VDYSLVIHYNVTVSSADDIRQHTNLHI